MCLRESGQDLNGLVVARHCCLKLFELHERVAAVEIGVGEIGPDRDGLVVAGNRRVELFQLRQCIPAVCVSIDIIGRNGSGLVIGRNRRIELPEFPKDKSAVVVGWRMTWIDFERLRHQVHCRCRVLRLRGQRSKQLQGIELIRLSIQDLHINRLRFLKLTSLMKSDRLLQQLIDRRRRLRHLAI